MQVYHLSSVVCRQPALQPIHRTTINEIEKLRKNFRNFDQQVLLYRTDFSANTEHLNRKPTNDHLNNILEFVNSTETSYHPKKNLPILPGMISKFSPSLINIGVPEMSDIRFHWNVKGGV